MKRRANRYAVFCFFILTGVLYLAKGISQLNNKPFVTYIADPKKQNICLFWKNKNGERYRSIQNLKISLEKNNKPLLFAMNGGMYKQDGSPQGLYIENKKVLADLDSSTRTGNFYLKPNGVFYITADNTAGVCQTKDFENKKEIKFATQSGPMLVIEGEIHPAFKKESINLNIRNGVGILPGNKIIFAMSKKEISFHDFANYFKSMGCKNALYLDGFVSRTYLPQEKWVQTDGDFGVIIGVIKASH